MFCYELKLDHQNNFITFISLKLGILDLTKVDIETRLVVALKGGDVEAFDKLFELYGKRLYHFAYGYLKSKEESEGVVQDVFMKIWDTKELLKPDLSFRAFLFKIAYNRIQELFLKLNRDKAYHHEIINTTVSFNDDLEDRMDYHSLLELVEEMINKLPERQKQVLILKRKEGLPVKEIAEKLDISPKTVENHLTEAIKKLKEGLRDEKIAGLLFFSLFLNYSFDFSS